MNKDAKKRKDTEISLGACLDLSAQDLPYLPVKESRGNGKFMN